MVESVDKTSCAWHCSSVLSHSVSDGKYFATGVAKYLLVGWVTGVRERLPKIAVSPCAGWRWCLVGGEGSCKYLEYSMFLVVSRL